MKVSVIIPCFNVESYIENCLQSVVSQTHQNIEIICVNDGSSDDTSTIIKRFQKHSNFNLQLLNQPNRGAGFSRNIGLKLAKGAYIQFLDADDSLHPKKIEHQINLIDSKKEKPSFLVGDYVLKSSTGEKVIRAYEKRPFLALVSKNLGITSANLWNKKAMMMVNGFNQDLQSTQEYDLMFRLLKAGGDVLFDPLLLTYKINRLTDSITSQNQKENRIRFICLQLRVLDYLNRDGNLDPEVKNYIYHKILYDIRLLYDLDPEKSYQLYQEHIPSSLKLKETPEISKKYVKAYTLFGYQTTQKVWGLYHKLFR